MSSVTRICPSHSAEAPMPIVGTRIVEVMRAASGATTPSITTAKAPASVTARASATIASASAACLPRAA